jgi:hypothetical protein
MKEKAKSLKKAGKKSWVVKPSLFDAPDSLLGLGVTSPPPLAAAPTVSEAPAPTLPVSSSASGPAPNVPGAPVPTVAVRRPSMANARAHAEAELVKLKSNTPLSDDKCKKPGLLLHAPMSMLH